MRHLTAGSLLTVLLLAIMVSLPADALAHPSEGRYIVVLKDSIERPGRVAEQHAQARGAKVGHVYGTALKGYAATLSKGARQAIEHDPRVAFVERDRPITTAAQEIPTGIDRSFASANEAVKIDGLDARVDADVAVLDTPVDNDHPDLNVVEETHCADDETAATVGCKDLGGPGNRGSLHGTHVAGTVGALDDAKGVVGVAPGARIWSVHVLTTWGHGHMSWAVAGVDWVTERADEIDVVNMSFGWPEPSPALEQAISTSVEAGVVYVVAAHNWDIDSDQVSPARHPDVITVSALLDTDGLAGGLGPGVRWDSPCDQLEPPLPGADGDDTLAWFSNWGTGIEVAAPGVCIRSTTFSGGYGWLSGTSMAAPHVAGAAAILASRDKPSSRSEVLALRQQIVDAGNFDWVDDSGDGVQEPLLDMSHEGLFSPELGCSSSVPGRSDVDGDCRADLVTLDGSGTVNVMKGTDGGPDTSSTVTSFENAMDPALFDGVGDYVVDVSDVDGDGRADLVVNSMGGSVRVHAGQPGGSFGQAVESASGHWPLVLDGSTAIMFEPVAVADVTGDGHGDIVHAFELAGSLTAVTVVRGNSGGEFAGASGLTPSFDSALFDGVGNYFLEVADVDGDGHADLITFHLDAFNAVGEVRVHRGRADAEFDPAIVAIPSINPVLDDGVGHEPVGVADVTGDGRADIVMRSGGGQLKLYRGLSSGTFDAPTLALPGYVDSDLTDGSGEQLVGVLDYDGDGRADFVSVDDGGQLLAYDAQSDGTFAAPTAQAANIVSTRADENGHQFATERPFIRRPGCTPTGCPWPPGE